MKESYGTLSETINGLKSEGYTFDFNTSGEFIVGDQAQTKLQPGDFNIDRVYRFEGASDPDDQSILYAISSKKNNVKGILVNGYGISANSEINKLVAKLSTHPA